MDLETTVAIMAAILCGPKHDSAKRFASVRNARLLLQEVQRTKLYQPIEGD